VRLVDTSVWVDHLRASNERLAQLLDRGEALIHPFVIGEISLGNLRQRDVVLRTLALLPGATVATDAEVLHFIDRRALFGHGVGYVDAHLLAATSLTAGALLWTYDKRLHEAAVRLGLAAFSV
jgi:predicted nucleic acid-binding protein